MDFDPSDLQRMLLDSADRFLAERFSLERRRALRASPDGSDGEAWAGFAELGWLSILVPEALGGLGGTMADLCVLATALGRACVAEPFASSAVIAASLLSSVATPDTALIEALVAGHARFALADEEPGSRYPSATAPRRTTLAARGNAFALDGAKTVAFDAPSATHLVVTAEAPDGHALVLLAADAPGIERMPYPLHDGSRAADIAFRDVAVPPDAVIATGAAADTLLEVALDRVRLADAAQMVGSMEADLDLCSAYLKERQQFGQPIGRFQALQHIMADMLVAAHQARSILYFALSALDGDPGARARAVSLARVRIGEAALFVARQSIQLHGGYGITDEYAVSHHYRRQFVLEKRYGDIDFHLRRLAQASQETARVRA